MRKRTHTRERTGFHCAHRGTELFFFLTLRNKWSGSSELVRENKEKESCCEELSILTVRLAHLGHLFFRCHLSRQWQMTQQQSGGSGRRSPGTRSPQAKLVQDLVHLRLLPLPAPLPPLQSIQHPNGLLILLPGSLFSWFHSSPCSGTFLPLSVSRSLSFPSPLSVCFLIPLLWDTVWLRTLASVGGKGEICESMVSRWRRGSLRIVVYWMCQLWRKCAREESHTPSVKCTGSDPPSPSLPHPSCLSFSVSLYLAFSLNDTFWNCWVFDSTFPWKLNNLLGLSLWPLGAVLLHSNEISIFLKISCLSPPPPANRLLYHPPPRISRVRTPDFSTQPD